MEIAFREAPRESDAAAIRATTAGTGFFRPDEVDVAVELVEERLAKGVASGYHFLFAESGGTMLGYACYGPIPCTIGSYDLYWIVVDKGAQGLGVGRRLAGMTERSCAAMGGRRLYVETAGKEQYAPTRAFYEGVGYFRVAEFPDFYDLGDAKIVYQKNL